VGVTELADELQINKSTAEVFEAMTAMQQELQAENERLKSSSTTETTK
jgi:hypothetical protein